MIGIKAIGSYLPSASIDNVARAAQLDAEEQFVVNKLGFLHLPRMAKGLETSDLCVESFNDLRKREKFTIEDIDCLVVCTQTPDGAGLPHTSAMVQHKLALSDNVAAFDISLGCSGYIYSLSVVTSFMEANGLKKGLLFTADPYSKILDSSDRNTELLFADGATCTLLTVDPRYCLLKTVFATNGAGKEAIMVDPRTGKLSMKGRDVYMFVMKKVPGQISQCLQRNGLTKEEVDLFVLHQGSKYIVENLRDRLGVSAEKAPFRAWESGNTVSSTIPLLLQQRLNHGYPTILLSGFGVGLSWATTILKKSE